MCRTYQMARVLKVASRIHHQPRQWTRPRLADNLGVDKGTIQRDINLLREMGIQIVARGKQGYEMNSYFFLPALNLDFEETLALITAASVHRASEGQQTRNALDNAIAKIAIGLPKSTQRVLRQIAPQIDIPDSQVSEPDEIQSHRETLYDAIHQRLKVTMTYDSFSSAKRTRHRISPYAVIFRKHAWYVIGHSETRRRVLTFRINRIHRLSITHPPYTIPGDFSVQKYLEKSWDVMLGAETHVVIKFAPRIAPLIQEVRWHPTQKLHTMPDGKLIFEVAVAGLREIAWWVMTWGDGAEVLEPKELRERVIETTRKMVEVYQEN